MFCSNPYPSIRVKHQQHPCKEASKDGTCTCRGLRPGRTELRGACAWAVHLAEPISRGGLRNPPVNQPPKMQQVWMARQQQHDANLAEWAANQTTLDAARCASAAAQPGSDQLPAAAQRISKPTDKPTRRPAETSAAQRLDQQHSLLSQLWPPGPPRPEHRAAVNLGQRGPRSHGARACFQRALGPAGFGACRHQQRRRQDQLECGHHASAEVRPHSSCPPRSRPCFTQLPSRTPARCCCCARLQRQGPDRAGVQDRPR